MKTSLFCLSLLFFFTVAFAMGTYFPIPISMWEYWDQLQQGEPEAYPFFGWIVTTCFFGIAGYVWGLIVRRRWKNHATTPAYLSAIIIWEIVAGIWMHLDFQSKIDFVYLYLIGFSDDYNVTQIFHVLTLIWPFCAWLGTGMAFKICEWDDRPRAWARDAESKI